MNNSKFLQQTIEVLLVILFLSGCNAPGTSPQASTCNENELSPLGVLRSTDHGKTWSSLGDACMRDLSINPADPTGLTLDNRIALYFIDFDSLQQPVPQNIYRTISEDGVTFDEPQPVYTQADEMVDPFVLRLADGSFRMYVVSSEDGVISAISRDGLAFSRENDIRSIAGAMPGALLLSDNRVRLFLAGGNEGQEGIFSQISTDGINFTTENGVRIPAPPNTVVDNPQPIHLKDGSYLMLWQVHERKNEGLPPGEHTEIHLANSMDGFNWYSNPTVIGYGGTSCVIELDNGTLLIYYGH